MPSWDNVSKPCSIIMSASALQSGGVGLFLNLMPISPPLLSCFQFSYYIECKFFPVSLWLSTLLLSSGASKANILTLSSPWPTYVHINFSKFILLLNSQGNKCCLSPFSKAGSTDKRYTLPNFRKSLRSRRQNAI